MKFRKTIQVQAPPEFKAAAMPSMASVERITNTQ
jgi:hypothetical protein